VSDTALRPSASAVAAADPSAPGGRLAPAWRPGGTRVAPACHPPGV